MKKFAPLALVFTSQTAAACALGGPGMGAGSSGTGLGAGALMAGAAVLGWWVLTRARQETDKALLWSGRVLGWLLLTVGLAGFLCASLSHAAKALKACSSCALHGSEGVGASALPPGHPPLDVPHRP